MPSGFMTPELVVQSPAFLLEVGPFCSSGVCEPGKQQEGCLTLEYPSEHVAKPWLPSQQLVSWVLDASTSLGSSVGLCNSAVTDGEWGAVL